MRLSSEHPAQQAGAKAACRVERPSSLRWTNANECLIQNCDECLPVYAWNGAVQEGAHHATVLAGRSKAEWFTGICLQVCSHVAIVLVSCTRHHVRSLTRCRQRPTRSSIFVYNPGSEHLCLAALKHRNCPEAIIRCSLSQHQRSGNPGSLPASLWRQAG